MTVLSTKTHKQRGGGKLSHVNPEQYEIGQMSREQRKRLNENIRNYKTDGKNHLLNSLKHLPTVLPMAIALTLIGLGLRII